jgi:hypothetical protein
MVQAISGYPDALAFTNPYTPLINYTANNMYNMLAVTPAPLNFYQGTQIWELGNSLSSINSWLTGDAQPTMGNGEPGQSFCQAVQGCMAATGH